MTIPFAQIKWVMHLSLHIHSLPISLPTITVVMLKFARLIGANGETHAKGKIFGVSNFHEITCNRVLPMIAPA